MVYCLNIIYVYGRLSSYLEPELGARVRFSLSANVNTPFFKYWHQNSGPVPLPGYKVLTLYWGTKWYLGIWRFRDWTRHYFYQYLSTSAWQSGVNTALISIGDLLFSSPEPSVLFDREVRETAEPFSCAALWKRMATYGFEVRRANYSAKLPRVNRVAFFNLFFVKV